jgi:hypothetical protein
MKKLSFWRIQPLQFQASLAVLKDLRQQQSAYYSHYHRVVGAFYAPPTVPLAATVETMVPSGLWRKQPTVQWLLAGGELGGRASLVASVAEVRAQLQEQYQQQAAARLAPP